MKSSSLRQHTLRHAISSASTFAMVLTIAACGSPSDRPNAMNNASADNPPGGTPANPLGGADRGAQDVPAASSTPVTPPMAPGSLDNTYGSSGVVTGLEDHAPSVTFSRSGRALVLEKMTASNMFARFTVLLAGGAPDLAHGVGGLANVAIPGAGSHGCTGFGLIEDDGSVVLAGGILLPDAGSASKPFVARFKNGVLDSAFGTSGLWTFPDRYAAVSQLLAERDAAGAVIGYFARVNFASLGDLGGLPRDASVRVYRLTASGAVDVAFGSGGHVEAAGVNFMVLDGAGSLIVVSGAGSSAELRRLTKTGDVDATFGVAGTSTVVIPQSTTFINWLGLKGGGVLAALQDETSVRTRIVRIGSGGALADAFPGTPTLELSGRLLSLAGELSDGRFLATRYDGGSTRIERRKADGTPDIAFGTAGTVELAKVAGADDFLAASPTTTGATMLATTHPGGVVKGGYVTAWSVRRLTP